MEKKIKQQRLACRKKFLRFFNKGFADKRYIVWEREYKWNAHLNWQQQLHRSLYKKLLSQKKYRAIADIAVKIESGTNLLFSFEKMALRDAVKSPLGAQKFTVGLYHYLYGKETFEKRFENFVAVIAALPRKQTRVLTWPLVTVFGFLAEPEVHIFLKPRVTQRAAQEYNFSFDYQSKPNLATYNSLLNFANQIGIDNKDLKPLDYIDLQSFIWATGSDEYKE